MKVLVLKPDHLGDFAVALPALWETSQRLPGPRDLCVLASPANQEWREILPWLPNLHPIYYPKYAPAPGVDWNRLAGAFRDTWNLGCAQGPFDWGIELTSWDAAPWGKLLLRAAGPARLRGTAVRRQGWLMDETTPARGGAGPQSERLAGRFPVAWGIRGTTPPADFMPPGWRWERSAASRPIVIMPWAGESFKEWPVAGWRALRRESRASRPWRLLAPPGRLAGAREWRDAVGSAGIEIAEVRGIRETLAELRAAALAVSVDTATAHYAWLVGTPLVELFSAAAEAEQWGSLATGEIIAPGRSAAGLTHEEKSRAGATLMAHITVNRVAAAMERWQ